MTKRIPPYSPEVRARAVRMVFDHPGEQPRKRPRSARLPPRSAARPRLCATGFARPSAIRAGAPVRPRPSTSASNALAETINGLYKAEVIHRRGPWRSFEAVEFATLEWVDWFNHRRLLEPIGNVPPAEAEERYYDQMEVPARAA